MTDEYAISPSVVSPDVEGTAQALEKFLELKERVLQPDDTVVISGKKYIKRSGWRKIALAFNVTTEIVSVERDYSSDLKVCHVKARAIAPNGRVSEEIASCDSTEFQGNIKFSIHNLETKAATRAINRAISNLVGGGEVSAEEIETEVENYRNNEDKSNKTQANPASQPASQGQKAYINDLIADVRRKDPQILRDLEINKRKIDEIKIESLTKDEASDLIEKLRDIRMKLMEGGNKA